MALTSATFFFLIHVFGISTATDFISLQDDICPELSMNYINCNYRSAGFYYSNGENHFVQRISFMRFTDSVLLVDNLTSLVELIVDNSPFDNRELCKRVASVYYGTLKTIRVRIGSERPATCTIHPNKALLHDTEAITEATTEAITEVTTEATTEAITEPITEALTEPITEPITAEAVTEPISAEAVTKATTMQKHSFTSSPTTHVSNPSTTQTVSKKLMNAVIGMGVFLGIAIAILLILLTKKMKKKQ